MSVRSKLGDIRRGLIGGLYSRRMPLQGRGPIVSFTFDDFPHSAYATGGAILKSFGVRGTYYAAMGLMDQSNTLGTQFCRDDLERLLKDGHELASHTFSHVSCRSVSAEAFAHDVDEGREAIQALCGQPDSGNFAFPFGDVSLGARKMISSRVKSCRTTWHGLNGPGVNLSFLRANSLYGDDDKAHQAQKLIVENEVRQSWLIFYTHDVRPDHSQFGCSPSLFESVVSFAARREARIMTVAKVIAELHGCTIPSVAATNLADSLGVGGHEHLDSPRVETQQCSAS